MFLLCFLGSILNIACGNLTGLVTNHSAFKENLVNRFGI